MTQIAVSFSEPPVSLQLVSICISSATHNVVGDRVLNSCGLSVKGFTMDVRDSFARGTTIGYCGLYN